MTTKKTYTQEEVVKIVEKMMTLRVDQSKDDVFEAFGMDKKTMTDIAMPIVGQLLRLKGEKAMKESDSIAWAIKKVWTDEKLDTLTKKLMGVFLIGGFLGFALGIMKAEDEEYGDIFKGLNPEQEN